MNRKTIVSMLTFAFIFFLTTICMAAPKEKKESANANKQSIETSTRGKERAEQRQEMKEGGEIGPKSDDSSGDNADKNDKEKKEKKAKREKEREKSKEDMDKGSKDSDDDKDKKDDVSGSNDETKTERGRWWDILKKSEK